MRSARRAAHAVLDALVGTALLALVILGGVLVLNLVLLILFAVVTATGIVVSAAVQGLAALVLP